MVVCHVRLWMTQDNLPPPAPWQALAFKSLTASGDIAPDTPPARNVIHVSKMERHDHVQRAVRGSDHGAALAEAGVELLAEDGSFGAVRRKKPAIDPCSEMNQGKEDGRFWAHDAPQSRCSGLTRPAKAGCGGSNWSCGRDLFILWGNVLLRRSLRETTMKLYVTFTSPYARLARIVVVEKGLQ